MDGQSDLGKWFGIAEVNGVLLASNGRSIYRRIDGSAPRWVPVAEFPPAGASGNPEVRGLTAVPNVPERTKWVEREMLFCSTQGKLWRMRVPPVIETEHSLQEELDMRSFLSRQLGRPVLYAEAAFNRLRKFSLPGGVEAFQPIGVQFVYGTGSFREQRRKLRRRGLDPASDIVPKKAYYLLRSPRGEYTLRWILDPTEPERVLFVARDFEVSPFPGEENVLYAGGFNGSFFKGSLGTAWGLPGRTCRDGSARPLTHRSLLQGRNQMLKVRALRGLSNSRSSTVPSGIGKPEACRTFGRPANSTQCVSDQDSPSREHQMRNPATSS